MTTSKIKAVAATVLVVAGLAGVGAGVVLACGGGFLRPTPPPATALKPPPDRSVETREDGSASAATAKPMAGVDPASDKPAADGGGAAKPARFILVNPARDITVVSDRDETFVEFFRRQRVLVAQITPKELDAILAAKKPTDRMFLQQASYNDESMNVAVYGSFLRIAPVADEQLIDVLYSVMDDHGVVLVPDGKERDLWHFAGFTRRPSLGFFASKERKGRDDFAPADLKFTPKKN